MAVSVAGSVTEGLTRKGFIIDRVVVDCVKLKNILINRLQLPKWRFGQKEKNKIFF